MSTTIYILSRNMKNIGVFFYLKIFIFLEMKFFIYLNRRVFVMSYFKNGGICCFFLEDSGNVMFYSYHIDQLKARKSYVIFKSSVVHRSREMKQ